MKKILLCLCLLAGYGMAQDNVNSTSRDKNGFFLGFELGVSEIGGEMSALGAKFKSVAPMYGFRAGYKGFFNEYIGLAGYVSFRDSFGMSESPGGKESSYFMPIMANIDLLYDFYNTQNVSFGAFVGIGLGGALYKNNDISNTSGFYSDVKIGLSSSFDNNQISLIASFPIAPMSDTIEGVKIKMKQNYAVSLAYDYKF